MINIKRLTPTATIPQYQTGGSAGFDLHSDENTVIPSQGWRAVGTGLAFAIPSGYEVQIRPRSGLALKHGITVLNAPGTIDSDYRGEVKVLLINHGTEPFTIRKGDRIAQGVFSLVYMTSFLEVSDLDDTERRGGFGSTGV